MLPAPNTQGTALALWVRTRLAHPCPYAQVKGETEPGHVVSLAGDGASPRPQRCLLRGSGM